jgi:hypothetical protein
MLATASAIPRAVSDKKQPNLSALYEAATSARSTEPLAVERRTRPPRRSK